jgi:uncharacterized protein (DUF608 family)
MYDNRSIDYVNGFTCVGKYSDGTCINNNAVIEQFFAQLLKLPDFRPTNSDAYIREGIESLKHRND